MAEWYLYMVRTRTRSLYTGITTDVDRRMKEHRDGNGKGAKFLRGKGPLKLVFQTRVGSKSLALKLEYRIKRLTHLQKERLIVSCDDSALPGVFEDISLNRK